MKRQKINDDFCIFKNVTDMLIEVFSSHRTWTTFDKIYRQDEGEKYKFYSYTFCRTGLYVYSDLICSLNSYHKLRCIHFMRSIILHTFISNGEYMKNETDIPTF